MIGALILAFAGASHAVDSSKVASYYVENGHTAGYLTNKGMQAVLEGDNLYIDTTIRYQLQRKGITVPIGMTSAAGDTFYTAILNVPTGLTYYIESMQISCWDTGASGTGVALGEILYHKWQGDTILVLDTLVTKMELDGDSTIGLAMADSFYTLTITDSTLTGGELVFWKQYNEGASTTEGPAVTILYRQDE